nr:hypothetical protein [uncultured bacterium]
MLTKNLLRFIMSTLGYRKRWRRLGRIPFEREFLLRDISFRRSVLEASSPSLCFIMFRGR